MSSFFSRLRLPILGRQRRITIEIPPNLLVDARGLPGDLPGDVDFVLSKLLPALKYSNIRWCIVGDILLEYYGVPKVVGDIEICVPSEDLTHARNTIASLGEFCFPFRPLVGQYNRHAAPHSRFRVKGMNQCFVLIPAEAYGLSSIHFSKLLYPSHIAYPLLPLPVYIQGLLVALATEPDGNFDCQLEFLIDGMDIDEEWCTRYLRGPALEYVLTRSTRNRKKSRMGSHPKYDGNITTYIHSESERQVALSTLGRDI